MRRAVQVLPPDWRKVLLMSASADTCHSCRNPAVFHPHFDTEWRVMAVTPVLHYVESFSFNLSFSPFSDPDTPTQTLDTEQWSSYVSELVTHTCNSEGIAALNISAVQRDSVTQ